MPHPLTDSLSHPNELWSFRSRNRDVFVDVTACAYVSLASVKREHKANKSVKLLLKTDLKGCRMSHYGLFFFCFFYWWKYYIPHITNWSSHWWHWLINPYCRKTTMLALRIKSVSQIVIIGLVIIGVCVNTWLLLCLGRALRSVYLINVICTEWPHWYISTRLHSGHCVLI